MNDAQLVRGVQSPRRLLKDFRNLRHGKRTPPREGLTKGFAFQKFHGDVGGAVIGLAGFVNGDDVGVMNAARGSRFILEAQQEVRVIQELAAQDFERHQAVANRDLLGEEDRTHAARAQTAHDAKTSRESGGKLRFGFRGLGHELTAVTRTELDGIRVRLLASVANLHRCQGNTPVRLILTEPFPYMKSPLDGQKLVLGRFVTRWTRATQGGILISEMNRTDLQILAEERLTDAQV